MTYLITGATGEVGSRVVRQLLERNIRPRVLVRSEERRARCLEIVSTSVWAISQRQTPCGEPFRGRTPFFS
jgi:nucleoside-diphosphate-sugar epimerase